MICICCLRDTQSRCSGCGVILCQQCSINGLCGLCVRMEQHRQEHQMLGWSRKRVGEAALILNQGEHWSARSAQLKCNEETDYCEVL